MATRQTRLITKNSISSGAPLPSGVNALKGEAVVNLNDGILFYSGNPGGNFVPSNNGVSGYFEVGSNIYDLRVRNSATVANLLTVNNLTVTGSTNLGSLTAGTSTINGNLTVTGTTNLSGLTLYDETVGGLNPLEVVNVNYLTGFVQTTDVYVTGVTQVSAATDNSNGQTYSLQYHGTPIGTPPYNITVDDTFVTGGTYASGTITFKYNDSSKTDFTVTGIDGTDTYVTAFTYTASANTFTIFQNQGELPLPVSFTEVSGLTVNGDLTVTGTSTIGTIISSALSTGRVVYTTTGGQLTTEAGFEYDQNTDTLTVDNVKATGDVVIDGNLTVYGASISAFTSNLYVEDNNIFLNYNPTGTTTGSSLGAGWTIQDGSGISNTATTLNIGKSFGNSNFTNTEYLSAVGNENRNLFTQVGDILIRNTNYNENDPDGKRVLAEGDILDGGTY